MSDLTDRIAAEHHHWAFVESGTNRMDCQCGDRFADLEAHAAHIAEETETAVLEYAASIVERTDSYGDGAWCLANAASAIRQSGGIP